MENFDQRPDIWVGVAEWLPDEFEACVMEQLRSSGACAAVRRLSTGPFAGAELYLPTAVGIFIVAGFFNGFLSKAGEDAYEVVKTAAKGLFRKTKPLNIQTIGTPGKVLDTGYSIAFAVGCELLPQLRVKFLVREDQTIQEAETGIALFLDLMRDIHADRLSEQELSPLFPFRGVGGTVLMTYDQGAGIITPVDGLAQTPLAAPVPKPHKNE